MNMENLPIVVPTKGFEIKEGKVQQLVDGTISGGILGCFATVTIGSTQIVINPRRWIASLQTFLAEQEETEVKAVDAILSPIKEKKSPVYDGKGPQLPQIPPTEVDWEKYKKSQPNTPRIDPFPWANPNANRFRD